MLDSALAKLIGDLLMRGAFSPTILVLAAATIPSPSVAQVTYDQWEAMTEKHDSEVRARNADRDYFLVSTVKDGLSQVRFYVDRNVVREIDSAGFGRAWVDSYEVLGAKKPIRLRHSKMLLEVRCDDALPQIRFRTMIS